ncbi:MAG: MFS transporter [Anaerolineae bacterium]|nr:MFS transporter [Anaerolineae bacterium]
MDSAPNVSGYSGEGTAGRWQPTAAYLAVFASLGLVLASLGPALPFLAGRLGHSVDELAFLFSARAVGSVGGALLGGYLYDRHPGHPLLAVMLLILAAAIFLFPQAWLLPLLALALFVAGTGEGMLGVGVNTLISWEHPARAAPFLNGLHFAFGVGAFLAPMVIVASYRLTGYVALAYTVLALALLPLALWLVRLPSPLPLEGGGARVRPGADDTPVLVALVLFLALYVGAEIGFGGWIYSYALEREIAGETGAALLNSAYWGAFTLGRLVSIPLAALWRPRYLIPAHLLLALGGLGLLLLGRPQAAVWAGSVIFGWALAPIFPTTVALAGRRVPLTGRVTSWLMIGGSIGAMSLPWLLGRIFGAWGAQATMVALAIDLSLALLLLLALLGRGQVDHST